jgi:nitroreductase
MTIISYFYPKINTQMDLSLIVRGIIKKRRNINPDAFTGKKVDAEVVKEMLDAANWAPNHGLTEPWRFVVYEGEKVAQFGKLHADIYRDHTDEAQFLQKKYDTLLHKPDKASDVIVILLKRGEKQNIPLEEELAAVACAVQNMMLVATSHNVATYWGSGGMCYHPAMKAAFGLDGAEDKVMGWLFVGKIKNDDFPEGKRQSGIMDKVRWV